MRRLYERNIALEEEIGVLRGGGTRSMGGGSGGGGGVVVVRSLAEALHVSKDDEGNADDVVADSGSAALDSIMSVHAAAEAHLQMLLVQRDATISALRKVCARGAPSLPPRAAGGHAQCRAARHGERRRRYGLPRGRGPRR